MDFTMKPVLGISVCAALFCISSGLVTRCPSSGYTDGEQDEVICELDRSFYDACLLPPTTVTFTFLSADGVSATYCESSYSAFPSEGTPNTICPSCNCSTGPNGNNYTLKFIPVKAVHYNGSFQCETNCAVPPGPPNDDHTLCTPITWKPESTSTPTPVPPPNGCDINDTVGIENCTLNNGPHSGWVISGSDMLRWDFQNSKVVVLCYCCKEWVEAVIPVVYCLVSLIFCGILLIWRRPFFDDTWERWQILICVIGFIVWFNLGPVWFITYMTTAGVCGYYPFDKCTCNCIETTPPILPDCPRDDEHPGWEIAVFLLGLIFLLAWIVIFILILWRKWWPLQPDIHLFAKCGQCHKWHRFTVPFDDDTLQDIFIRTDLNEIFKKCASHDDKTLRPEEIEQKIQEIVKKRVMDDIRTLKLDQAICLKDHKTNKWYNQDRVPDRLVLDAVKRGTWRWSKGSGTEEGVEGMVELLQIRVYVLSISGAQ